MTRVAWAMHRSFPTFLGALEHIFGHVLDLLVGESFPKGALKLSLASFAVSGHPACTRVDEIVQLLDGIQAVLFQVSELQRFVGFDDVSSPGVTSGALQCEQLIRFCGPCGGLHPPHPHERTDRVCFPRARRVRSSSLRVDVVSRVRHAAVAFVRVVGTAWFAYVPCSLALGADSWMDPTHGGSVHPHVHVLPTSVAHGPLGTVDRRGVEATHVEHSWMWVYPFPFPPPIGFYSFSLGLGTSFLLHPGIVSFTFDPWIRPLSLVSP